MIAYVKCLTKPRVVKVVPKVERVGGTRRTEGTNWWDESMDGELGLRRMVEELEE